MTKHRPIIAITVGDPAGIGPEISLKALNDREVYDKCKPLLIGSAKICEQINDILNIQAKINPIQEVNEGKYEYGTVDVLDIDNIDMATFEFNKVSAMCGHASFEYVTTAIALAMEGKVDANVTGPIHKEAIQMAGHNFAGHTEIYAEFTQTKNYTMMLAEGHFRVVHVSTHVSLLEAIRRVQKDRILNVLKLGHEGLVQMGITNPKIAVAGLNPHAGENGLFGTEEIDHIIPAIVEAQNMGILASGPYPPDTIFPIMKGGKFDLVVCMYHDQGHIPTKLLGFNYNHEKQVWEGLSGVNITLGLPIIRVSVDHGVAFDKGGKGEASPQSMLQAIDYATKFAIEKIANTIEP
jgi:4-phospho-D-threonate 3-dehydrogenase / 4-phospho-D-erythronate 3-dehydrogenase